MQIFNIFLALLLSYLIGAVPFGWIIVKVATGKDVRKIGSGRVGGTNVYRAAGWFAGVLTAVADFFKGVVPYFFVAWLAPNNYWLQVIAAFLSVIGQVYSIFLLEKNQEGKWMFRGGAGGATALGGAVSMMMPNNFWHIFLLLPFVVLVYFVGGYASVTTMSIPVLGAIYFVIRALNGAAPWEYLAYSLLSELMVLWALRPNLKRLFEGTERPVGFRAKFKAQNKRYWF
jgi:glycerol-3-phosphate acyltransferase PlsY